MALFWIGQIPINTWDFNVSPLENYKRQYFNTASKYYGLKARILTEFNNVQTIVNPVTLESVETLESYDIKEYILNYINNDPYVCEDPSLLDKILYYINYAVARIVITFEDAVKDLITFLSDIGLQDLLEGWQTTLEDAVEWLETEVKNLVSNIEEGLKDVYKFSENVVNTIVNTSLQTLGLVDNVLEYGIFTFTGIEIDIPEIKFSRSGFQTTLENAWDDVFGWL